ncbi:hypothetical protein [Endozoicomonas sp. Mp262]|uniref:hypothetical protein n=1 Tax=Endozoicomonas sp. Mp262 TaxID=2919499 RepID=UPI0021D8A42E
MSYYYSTRQALLSAFDLRGLMYKSYWPAYEQDHPTVNRHTTEPSDFKERLAQDARVRAALRESLSEYDYTMLAYCYTVDGLLLFDCWRKIKPVLRGCSELARRLSNELLMQWFFDRHNVYRVKCGVGNREIAETLGVSERTVRRKLVAPVRAVFAIADIEDRAGQVIGDKGWFIGNAA